MRYKCEPLNRTSSRIVQVAEASELAQEFRIVLPAKVKIKNSTSSVYSRLYGIHCVIIEVYIDAFFEVNIDAFFEVSIHAFFTVLFGVFYFRF